MKEEGTREVASGAAQTQAAKLHQAFVDGLRDRGFLPAARIEAAFRAVPRHLFLPGVPLETVYHDEAIVTKRLGRLPASSSSMPSLMADMLAALDPQPGQRVLEIGAGTGYNAALLARLTGPTGQVVTVDIDDDLVLGARDHLRAAGCTAVQVIRADGGLGYPAAAPYDRIIITAGADDIPPAWREQLAPGGRLVIPLTLAPVDPLHNPQFLLTFEPTADYVTSVAVRQCGFMPLRGAFATEPPRLLPLGPQAQLYSGSPDQVDVAAVRQALRQTGRDRSTTIRVSPRESIGLRIWLALREAVACLLYARGAFVEQNANSFAGPPSVVGLTTFVGLADGGTTCVLLHRPDAIASRGMPAELVVRSFGPDNQLADRLIAQITAWERAGRPGRWGPHGAIAGFRVRAYMRGTEHVPMAHEAVITRRWAQLICD